MHLFFLENEIKPDQIQRIGFSSVVPDVILIVEQFCRHYLGKPVFRVNAKRYKNLRVSTKNPNEIGSDLMCNVTAAYEKFGKSVIIVDFGTALTFTAVSDTGEILGVNIVPGLHTAVKALSMNTAKLPLVKLEFPKSALGTNTTESIQAGILYGYTGLVKGMLQAIEGELGFPSKIIATGGLSAILHTLKDRFDLVDRNLTLEGIRLITLANGK
jgi:type III pantothenate kinase